MNDNRADRKADDPELTDELRSFAADLSRLCPRDDRLNRERLAFLAGRASATSDTHRTANLFGLPLESRAWPAAFAAMTTIAASLAVVLCLRSENSRSGSSFVSQPYDRAAAPFVLEVRKGTDVLCTRDAYLPDLESRLAGRDKNQREAGAAAPATNGEKRPVLTTTSWDQAIYGAPPTHASPDDSSGLLRNQGAKS